MEESKAREKKGREGKEEDRREEKKEGRKEKKSVRGRAQGGDQESEKWE